MSGSWQRSALKRLEFIFLDVACRDFQHEKRFEDRGGDVL
jgi:hypothetical protein